MMPVLIIAMLGVVLVLVAGIFLMGKGGEANKKYANKLMVARISFQALAVVCVVLLLWAGHK